ncbi:MAG: amidohydrolase family protein [Alphaproteobacteria bacterium]|nr:amidohydrolase family protein [Alphaproteobacteria bacterium]
MKIVDSQVHIWGADTPERPWPARHPPHREPLDKLELAAEMDKAGVHRAIIVPPSGEGDRNDRANDAATTHPDRFATMGRFDPDAPGARETIKDWKKQPGMLGMRFTFHTDVLRQPLSDGRFDWVWGEMEKLGIPAMVLFHHEYMHLADMVAEGYPGLRLVLDHLGLKSAKDVSEANNFATLDNVLALAKRPNVAAKVSAMPCYADDKTYPFKSVHPHIRRVFDAFGPRRTFWGTDWSRLPCSYRQGVTMFTEEMPWLKGQDLDWVMGRGVCEWLGWKL